MWPLKKKRDIKIINTGSHLPEATVEQEMRFLGEQDRFLKTTVLKQVKRTGDVIYGRQAVNAQVGFNFSRPTSDFDIYSHKPRSRAVELEKSIDNHVGADISHVEQVNYERDKKKGKMFRVALKNYPSLADYNPMPKDVQVKKIRGINYETLGYAEKKYMKMIDNRERMINATQDLNSIKLFRYFGFGKKMF